MLISLCLCHCIVFVCRVWLKLKHSVRECSREKSGSRNSPVSSVTAFSLHSDQVWSSVFIPGVTAEITMTFVSRRHHYLTAWNKRGVIVCCCTPSHTRGSRAGHCLSSRLICGSGASGSVFLLDASGLPSSEAFWEFICIMRSWDCRNILTHSHVLNSFKILRRVLCSSSSPTTEIQSIIDTQCMFL